MQANLNTQAAREKAACFRHLLKQLKERLSSHRANCACLTVRTMQGKPDISATMTSVTISMVLGVEEPRPH